MAVYRTTLSLHGAYSVDRALLTAIFHRARTFLEEDVNVQLSFSDVHKIESTSLSDILNDDLLRTYVITEIRMSGNKYQSDSRRSFDFRATNAEFLPTFLVEIVGAQDASRTFASYLEPLLQAKRQWYSLMIPFDSQLKLAFLTVLALIVLGIPIGIAVFAGSETALWWVVTAEVTGMFWLLLLLNWARKSLFRKLIVEIGHSEELAQQVSAVRVVVLIGIVLSLIVGVASSLFANLLSK